MTTPPATSSSPLQSSMRCPSPPTETSRRVRRPGSPRSPTHSIVWSTPMARRLSLRFPRIRPTRRAWATSWPHIARCRTGQVIRPVRRPRSWSGTRPTRAACRSWQRTAISPWAVSTCGRPHPTPAGPPRSTLWTPASPRLSPTPIRTLVAPRRCGPNTQSAGLEACPWSAGTRSCPRRARCASRARSRARRTSSGTARSRLRYQATTQRFSTTAAAHHSLCWWPRSRAFPQRR